MKITFRQYRGKNCPNSIKRRKQAGIYSFYHHGNEVYAGSRIS